jgi:RNA polymerase sigma-70 factor (ECF subfamily)
MTAAQTIKASGAAQKAKIMLESTEPRILTPEEHVTVTFEDAVLPHLDAAYNLVRWLTRNAQDAEDVVQEACLRALRSFAKFRGGDIRTWLLTIVRNTCYTWLKQNRPLTTALEFDENIHEAQSNSVNAEGLLLQDADRQLLKQALEQLPLQFREVLVLRELEDLSYKQIAEQPALSQQRAKLEKRIENRLFDRLGRSVRLSELDGTFLPTARRVTRSGIGPESDR